MIFSKTLSERIDSGTVDAAKGLLITLVVLGHASNFSDPIDFFFNFVKYFHVACFLILPFIYDLRPFNLQYVYDRAGRYLIPFFLFGILYTAMYVVAVRPFDSVTDFIQAFVSLIVFANAAAIDQVTGLVALWFLPTYFITVCGIGLFFGICRFFVWPLVLVGIAAHIISASLPSDTHTLIPYGMGIFLHLFLLGVLLRLLFDKVRQVNLARYSFLFLFAFIACLAVSFLYDTRVKLPFMKMYGWDQPWFLLLHSTIILSFTAFLLSTPYVKKIPFMTWLGKYSLIIYMTHLPMLFVLDILRKHVVDPATLSWVEELPIVLSLTGLGLIIGTVCVYIFRAFPGLSAFVFPRDIKTWPPIQFFKFHHQDRA